MTSVNLAEWLKGAEVLKRAAADTCMHSLCGMPPHLADPSVRLMATMQWGQDRALIYWHPTEGYWAVLVWSYKGQARWTGAQITRQKIERARREIA